MHKTEMALEQGGHGRDMYKAVLLYRMVCEGAPHDGSSASYPGRKLRQQTTSLLNSRHQGANPVNTSGL